MQDTRTEVPLRLSTAESGDVDVSAIVDGRAETWLKSAMAGKQAIQVELRPSEDDDVRAHLGSDQSVVVTVVYKGGEDDDVEGHAMSLHFPSVEAARDFERKLLATGLIAGTVAISIVGVNTANQQLGSAAGAGAVAGSAPVVQYAPPAHDMDHTLSISLPAPASVSTGTQEHIGLSEAAAASSTADYAPAVRDTDRGDLGALAAPAGAGHGYVSAAAAAASAQDPAAQRAGDRYMSAAGAAAASAQDQLAMREGDRYMSAAAAAASSGAATDEHVGLSEMAAGAGAAESPQYAPTVRDTDRGDLGVPAASDDGDEQQRPGDRRL